MSELLSTYLNDHLAGATGGLELARRVARSNRGSDYGDALTVLAAEIEEDRESLLAIMRALGVGTDRLKVVAAWAGEKLGRLKPNGRLLSYSPLSRVEELELLVLGVHGKLLLWQVLAELGEDTEELEQRARSQKHTLERLRLRAAREMLR